MKPALTLLLLLAPVASPADAPSQVWNPHAAAILLHAHPHAWQPAVGTTRGVAGMTLTPETGASAAPPPADPNALEAYRSALANIPVHVRSDGSRYAKLGGLVRAYMVASMTPDGRLKQACVESRPEALARVRAGAPRAAGADEDCEDR
jgi:hypothetical protein